MNAPLRPLSATYRIQLRNGVTFDTIRQSLDYFADLGISHLYLSPVFTAHGGSTHGYDVTDPAEIDPTIGGEEGLVELSKAAQEKGLSIILDIVPNHTAFTLENKWLWDVLKRGEQSGYYMHFDIARDQRLVIPFLPAPFDTMVDEGKVSLKKDGDEVVMAVDVGGLDPMCVPIAEGTAPDNLDLSPDEIRAVHDQQMWQLRLWERERDMVTHRRFFNVTSLIGMRVEDPEVFHAMHELPLRLVKDGIVHGLRVDHIDGLADPIGYLNDLRAAAGETCPIWIEKILTGDEPLPIDWPVQGTTGYEAARQIVRLLTPPEGLAKLDFAWREATGITEDFDAMLAGCKMEVITQDLAAELGQLIELAAAACSSLPSEPGYETLREAVLALLSAFPRYRTYRAGTGSVTGEKRLWTAVIEEASDGLRTDDIARHMGKILTNPSTADETAFSQRFEQVTGALLAKSQEDTAFFRYNRYLAANEVGSEPDHTTIDVETLDEWLKDRQTNWPEAITLTSTHDTKRAEDARMRLVACSHLPDEFLALVDHEMAQMPDGVSANDAWYVVQSALAIWETGREDLADRLEEHIRKALREAKVITNWPYPNDEAEKPVFDAARGIIGRWRDSLPEQAQRLIAQAEMLSLAQVTLKMLMPGIPDIYQGSEKGNYHLTDPDNREVVDFAAMQHSAELGGFAGTKAKLIAALTQLRHEHAEFFSAASVDLTTTDNGLQLKRSKDGVEVCFEFNPLQSAYADIPQGAENLVETTDLPFTIYLVRQLAADISAA
ncbi:malto-oligosyltrehalose synthase [Marivivens donghaensis]|uniref:Malto-oligosyltrehalose synthase n=1 Tax=Marivivens donghaensis TaxID=1699413 RepID=A0ABX0W4W4_9RHOB|nr:malto-oligosyltrehalose synthase [Marivivens donghaensis]NIY73918.1 malto-oligosyltrehalose synthase [Marivivens donghaensis]